MWVAEGGGGGQLVGGWTLWLLGSGRFGYLAVDALGTWRWTLWVHGGGRFGYLAVDALVPFSGDVASFFFKTLLSCIVLCV